MQIARNSHRPQGRGARRRRAGFTLVELLTVIVIIGILAGMTTAAVWTAMVYTKRSRINFEIQSMAMALEQYKNEYGEYPPDFTDTAAVTRHLRKRFPNYGGGYADMRDDILDEYAIDIDGFSPASALVFWLGGLPMDAGGDYQAQGFHSDPEHPFVSGGPRTAPTFDGFKIDRIRLVNLDTDGDDIPDDVHELRYMADTKPNAPFVYFRSRVIDTVSARRGYEPSIDNNSTPANYADDTVSEQAYKWDDGDIAVPYQRAAGTWYEEEKFQIISAGLDGEFSTDSAEADRIPTASGFSDGDFDNQANFCDKAKLEDMQ